MNKTSLIFLCVDVVKEFKIEYSYIHKKGIYLQITYTERKRDTHTETSFVKFNQ